MSGRGRGLGVRGRTERLVLARFDYQSHFFARISDLQPLTPDPDPVLAFFDSNKCLES